MLCVVVVFLLSKYAFWDHFLGEQVTQGQSGPDFLRGNLVGCAGVSFIVFFFSFCARNSYVPQ